jgi:hypothetical protein
MLGKGGFGLPRTGSDPDPSNVTAISCRPPHMDFRLAGGIRLIHEPALVRRNMRAAFVRLTHGIGARNRKTTAALKRIQWR